jgi:protoporphyrinogen oxidase
VQYPFENGLGDLTPEANFDCISGYVNSWHQRKMDASQAPADFKSWIRWRFGDGIAEHFMDPYNEKIWKRDLSQITSDWVAGRVPDAPVEDVLRAAVDIRTEGYTHQAVFFYPKAGGFQAITDGIGSTLMDQVRLSTPVQEIARAHARPKGGWRVNDEDFDLVINTLPLNELPSLIANIPDEIGKAMGELSFNSLISLLIALDRPVHPDLSWIYLPHDSQGPANRVTYMSNYSPGNAPQGKTSYMAEITWPGGQPWPGKQIEEETLDGLVNAGILDRGEVLFTDRSQVKYAYIIYDHEFRARRSAALGWLKEQGLETIGRFGHYDYDNSDQCVIKARTLAGELIPRLLRG